MFLRAAVSVSPTALCVLVVNIASGAVQSPPQGSLEVSAKSVTRRGDADAGISAPPGAWGGIAAMVAAVPSREMPSTRA